MICTVTIDLHDAIRVGLNLASLGRDLKIHPSAREVFARVGKQMIAAAKAAQATEAAEVQP